MFFLVDLMTGINIGQISHDSKIDWLEVIFLNSFYTNLLINCPKNKADDP